MPLLHSAGWVLIAAGGALFVAGVVAWAGERAYLSTVLGEIAPGGTLASRDQLVALKTRLSRSIHWERARIHHRRPLLRASARRVLETGIGHCGENARVAVRLLRLGGVTAHRLYLEGEQWGHVVVEHRWEGRWRIFDAHADQRTALTDDQVGRIDADDLGAFPNRVADNPWHHSYRIPGLRRISPLLRGWRPPALLTHFAETPSLVGLSAGILVVLMGILLARL